MKQLYSVADERFLPDRYVVGSCPNCGYEQARGDQCENCTKLLDPTDLINPRSAISGSTTVEVRESRHLFLLQSRLVDELRSWIESRSDDWPILATSIAMKWLDEGLQDRSITRDLNWGVPVDWPGLEGKVYYVWFDAPIAYIAATKEWADDDPTDRSWRSWWQSTENVYYVQFMAKDNVPFHALGFPATIMGSRESWKLVDYIKAFNWLNYYGGKFSTSQGIGVFMSDALELLPADYWRYYLLANAPESSDSAFTWETFGSTVNKDLADTLGNFVNRTLKFTVNNFGNTVPRLEFGQAEHELAISLDMAVAEYATELEELRFRRATQRLRAVWAMGNSYLNDQAPWKTVATDPNRAAAVMGCAINLIRVFALLSAPLIPTTADRMLSALGQPRDTITWPGPMSEELRRVPERQPFSVPEVLFRKVTDDEIQHWSERFSGKG